jgi:hypothetical protein
MFEIFVAKMYLALGLLEKLIFKKCDPFMATSVMVRVKKKIWDFSIHFDQEILE